MNNKRITAVLLAAAMALDFCACGKPKAPESFSDVDADAWYAPYVEEARSSGIALGYEDGTFRPANYITAGEFVTMKQIQSDFNNVVVPGLYKEYVDSSADSVLQENTSSLATLQSMHGEYSKPAIIYYENDKKNIIAPKITGKAKTAVQETVNSTFITTLAEKLANIGSVISNSGVTVDDVLDNFTGGLDNIESNLRSAIAITDSLISVSQSAQSMTVVI